MLRSCKKALKSLRTLFKILEIWILVDTQWHLKMLEDTWWLLRKVDNSWWLLMTSILRFFYISGSSQMDKQTLIILESLCDWKLESLFQVFLILTCQIFQTVPTNFMWLPSMLETMSQISDLILWVCCWYHHIIIIIFKCDSISWRRDVCNWEKIVKSLPQWSSASS